MMTLIAYGLIGGGTGIASRMCTLSRVVGASLVTLGLMALAKPALADEHLIAADNGEVDCTISKTGLTRISLTDDRFASVSKLATGDDAQDFTVVNEPNRGDIYISLPTRYAKPGVSFFGTTSKGYVYKFACRIAGDGAQQVFVDNKDTAAKTPDAVAEVAVSPQESAAALVQAMYRNISADGFDIRQADMKPVRIGTLGVRMIAEYRGSDVTGRILRIENRGKAPVMLDETVIAPTEAVAISVANPDLPPGAVTTAYIVTRSGKVPAGNVPGARQ